MSKGWVKIRRSLLDWEWYDDHNATRLLLHLIITANYQEKKWKGVVLNPGSRVISWDKLASEIGLSKQQVRTSMRKLEITGEVTRKPTGLFQVVSLVKWEKMQIEEVDPNREVTPKRTEDQQKINREVTPTKESKEYKEINNSLYSESDFLNDWNTIRTKELKKPSHLNRIGGRDEKELFRSLVKHYTQQDFQNALKGLFKQQTFPRDNTSMRSNPSHFLKYFNTYLTAFHDQDKNIYGKSA